MCPRDNGRHETRVQTPVVHRCSASLPLFKLFSKKQKNFDYVWFTSHYGGPLLLQIVKSVDNKIDFAFSLMALQ
jgi:hypothetical protein